MDNNLIGIHHLGVVVDDIKDSSVTFVKTLGYLPESKIIFEKAQKVYVQFLTFNNFRVELIQPVDAKSPVYNFLKKGGFLNHICYESSDIEASKFFFKKKYGSVCVSCEMSESIIDCKVAFFAKPNGEIIEVIQPMNGIKYFT